MERYDRDPKNQPERNKSEENLVDVVGEAICDDQDAEIIMKYIHKKFSKYILWQTKVILTKKLCTKQSTNIANPCLADRSSLISVVKPEQQRSSVIVNPIQLSSKTQDLVNPPEFPQLTNQAYEVVKFNTQERKEQGKSKEEVDEMEELTLPAMENIDMVDLKDIQTICMSFLAEAPPFMQEKRELFYNAWYQVGTKQ